MVVQQKVAWLNLGVCIVILAGYGVLAPIYGYFRSLAVFSLMAVLAVPSFLPGWRKAIASRDERDILINRRAFLISFRIFWVCFFLATLAGYWFMTDIMHQTVVSLDYLVPALWFAGILFVILSSIATLVMYGRSQDHEA